MTAVRRLFGAKARPLLNPNGRRTASRVSHGGYANRDATVWLARLLALTAGWLRVIALLDCFDYSTRFLSLIALIMSYDSHDYEL